MILRDPKCNTVIWKSKTIFSLGHYSFSRRPTIREFPVTDRSSVTSLGQGSYVRGLLYIRNSYVWSLWHLLIYIWFSCFFSLILWKYGWRIALIYWWDRQCILIPIFILIPCLFESLFSTESEIGKLPTRVRQTGIFFCLGKINFTFSWEQGLE